MFSSIKRTFIFLTESFESNSLRFFSFSFAKPKIKPRSSLRFAFTFFFVFMLCYLISLIYFFVFIYKSMNNRITGINLYFFYLKFSTFICTNKDQLYQAKQIDKLKRFFGFLLLMKVNNHLNNLEIYDQSG